MGIVTYLHSINGEVLASTKKDATEREARWFVKYLTCNEYDNIWQEKTAGVLRGLFYRIDGVMYTEEEASML